MIQHHYQTHLRSIFKLKLANPTNTAKDLLYQTKARTVTSTRGQTVRVEVEKKERQAFFTFRRLVSPVKKKHQPTHSSWGEGYGSSCFRQSGHDVIGHR